MVATAKKLLLLMSGICLTVFRLNVMNGSSGSDVTLKKSSLSLQFGADEPQI